jgi:hypothetical protein
MNSKGPRHFVSACEMETALFSPQVQNQNVYF